MKATEQALTDAENTVDEQAIKNVLLAKQGEFEKRIGALIRDLSKLHSADSSEQAQERENDEVLEALLAEANEEVVLVKAALARIDAGEYGICIECGAEIDSKRLKAYPEAARCIHCAA